MHPKSNFQPHELEPQISFFSVLSFLKGAYKTIAIATLFGVMLTVGYLIVTPQKYEASALISMAQLNMSQQNSLGVNIEDSSMLIVRLTKPTSFSKQNISDCGTAGMDDPYLALMKNVSIDISNGSKNIVNLIVYANTSEAASFCAHSIYEQIKITQAQMISPYLEEAKLKLANYEAQLVRAKELNAKADKYNPEFIGATYLSARDEIRYLLTQITATKDLINSSHHLATKLVSPIYSSQIPVAPVKRVVLTAGLVGGFLFGVLVALIMQLFIESRREVRGAI